MAGKNRIVRSVAPKTIFPSAKNIVTGVSYKQGDLLVFDDTANKLKVPTAETEGLTFVGIAEHTLVSGKLASPYLGTDVDASAAVSEIPGPAYGVVAKLVLKTGAALNPGDLVYLNPAAGTYHVQEAGTKAIGVYAGPVISSAAAGQEVEILLGSRHPADALKL